MDRYAQAHKIATPAVSLSTDDGQHGSHCYDVNELLICGWPSDHGKAIRCKSTFFFRFDSGKPVRCERSIGHTGEHYNSFASRTWSRDQD